MISGVKNICLIISIFTLIVSCNKTDIDTKPDYMDRVVFEDIICLNPAIDWSTIDLFSTLKVTVNSQAAYNNLINSFYNDSNCGCQNFCEKDVDFSQYSLLACATHGVSSDAEYMREIIKDSEKKQIIYRITVNYINDENEAVNQFSLNWAKVPSIEFGYTVKFEVVE